jgi:hypothetical protein
MAAKKSKAGAVPLALSGMAPQLREVFQLSGLARLFAIHDDAAAAVTALSAQGGSSFHRPDDPLHLPASSQFLTRTQFPRLPDLR